MRRCVDSNRDLKLQDQARQVAQDLTNASRHGKERAKVKQMSIPSPIASTGDEHPCIACARKRDLQKLLIAPLVSLCMSDKKEWKIRGVGSSGLSLLGDMDAAHLRNGICSSIQNWIFYAHGHLKSNAHNVVHNPNGDPVFLHLNKHGEDLSKEFLKQQLLNANSKGNGTFTMAVEEEAMSFAQEMWCCIARLQDSLTKLKKQVLYEVKQAWGSEQYFNDETLGIQAEFKDVKDVDRVTLCFYDRNRNELLETSCYISHVYMLWESYKKFSKDPFEQSLLTRMFVVLCRYEIFTKLRPGAQGSISMETVNAMRQHFQVEYER